VFDRPARLVEAEPVQPEELRLAAIVQHSEARAILATLDACGGNRLATARRLGISERTLRYRLASLRGGGPSLAAGRC
jgi:two-component system response regulator FlrC